MPCNSDHMEPHPMEIQLSRVYALLDEVKVGLPIKAHSWDGYDKRAYGSASRVELDERTAELCELLKGRDTAEFYSLELQMWWRDHQLADLERARRELKEKRTKRTRERALGKLSAEEKRALGLERDQ